jgi:hypothetical protein
MVIAPVRSGSANPDPPGSVRERRDDEILRTGRGAVDARIADADEPGPLQLGVPLEVEEQRVAEERRVEEIGSLLGSPITKSVPREAWTCVSARTNAA